MDIARRHPTPALDEAVTAQIARIVGMWESALRRSGGDYLFGAFSIADCFYAPVATRFRTYGIPLPPVADAYCSRLLALPAMKEWVEEARKEPPKDAP